MGDGGFAFGHAPANGLPQLCERYFFGTFTSRDGDGRRRRAAAPSGGWIGKVGFDVGLADTAVAAAAGDSRQVDACFGGDAPRHGCGFDPAGEFAGNGR